MHNRKKICFVVSTIFTARVFLKDHIKLLAEHFDVYIVANLQDSELPVLKEFPIAGYHNVTIERKINLFSDMKAVISLANYFRKMDFASVHSVTPKAGLIAMLAARIANIPVRIHIFTGQVWHTLKGFKKNLLIGIDRLIASLTTHILVDGESQREYLIQHKVVNEKKSTVLAKGSISGVNTVRFTPKEDIRTSLRAELNLEQKVVFTFLGRMNQDKGMSELFDAFARLSKENANAHLLLIGPDEEGWTEKIKLYDSIREGDNYTNYGPTLNPQELLQAADVFCLPSYREGFGTSVIEASCIGLPVICSDTYGLRDTMVDEQTGLRHKVKDADSLYCQMKRLLESREMRDRFGHNGRNYVLNNFRGEQLSAAWLKFYQQILH